MDNSLNHLFKNIPHVGTLSYAVFVYLCICICVSVHETLDNMSFDILGPIAFRKNMVCIYIYCSEECHKVRKWSLVRSGGFRMGLVGLRA